MNIKALKFPSILVFIEILNASKIGTMSKTAYLEIFKRGGLVPSPSLFS